MKLKAITNVVTSKAGRQILKLQKHSPVLLFAAGVAGVVTTVVLASKATLKLDELLGEIQDDLEKVETIQLVGYDEDDRKKDKLTVYIRGGVRVAKLYAPAVGVGALAVAALTGSHVILTKRNIAVTAAYAAMAKGFQEYRERVANKLGVDGERELRYDLQEREIVIETKQGPKTKVVRDIPAGMSIYARVFSQDTSPSWQRGPGYNQMFIQCQQNYANDRLRARGHVFLNEVLDSLNLARVPEGQVVGWLLGGDGDDYIDFGIFNGDRMSADRFVQGHEHSVWLDFNVDGIVYDQI